MGAGNDFAGVRFEAACFGMSGGPEDKEVLLAEILRAGQLIVYARWPDRLVRRDRRRTGNRHHCRHRVVRVWPQPVRPKPGARAAGATSLATKAAGSTSRARLCAPHCVTRKAGAPEPYCAICSFRLLARRMPMTRCIGSTRRSIPARAWPHSHVSPTKRPSLAIRWPPASCTTRRSNWRR